MCNIYSINTSNVNALFQCLLSPCCPACEEQDSFLLLVKEEVVKGPQASLFTIRIRVKVRVITKGQSRMTNIENKGYDYSIPLVD